MFRRTFEIVGTSFKMALQELWKNKLRTFLSLFGVTIGIFCIIGVLATVNSLQHNIQNEISSLGSNTIYIDKWEYGGGPDYPWWKFVNRPVPKFEEVEYVRQRTPGAKRVAFCLQGRDGVEFSGSLLGNVNMYSVNDDYLSVQNIDVGEGRTISDAEFNYGSNVALVGNEIAAKLFTTPEAAVNKPVNIRGKRVIIAGVIKKQGKQLLGGWDFDQSIVLPFQFGRTIFNELKTDPVIIVQGRDNVTSKELKDQLFITMRTIRKLSPTADDNFGLNDINDLAKEVDSLFSGLNMAAAVIGGISLIVGLFGVANIMFVTVKERTSQIGLKKAIGAKRGIILTEFLLESAFLCIVGGLIGLLLVFLLAVILTKVIEFPVFVSAGNMAWTLVICVLVGVIAGLIPAIQAARMNAVEAIRSK